jgi:hypothetical protein
MLQIPLQHYYKGMRCSLVGPWKAIGDGPDKKVRTRATIAAPQD